MSLLDDINEQINTQKKTKAQKILEVKDEVNLMLKNKISLRKQIELLLKNNIVNKLDLSEYRNILIRHFNYEVNKQKSTKKKPIQTQKPIKSQSVAKSAKEILSQDIKLV